MQRHLVLMIGVITIFFVSHPALASHEETVRIGITPVIIDNRVAFLRSWQRYLEARIDQPVLFVQRNSYKEVTDLLISGELDAAWICGFPYVRHSTEFRLLVVPVFEGRPVYRSYVIVPQTDSTTKSLADLRGKIFAYSDPDSNSGYLVPQVELHKAGFDTHLFFSKEFFTWSHYNVVTAVADGLAQAGAVDGYVWETMRRDRPEIVARTRVLRRSQTFGFPPLVVNRNLPAGQFRKLRKIFLDMAEDARGRNLLDKLNLDGFVKGNDHLFDGIRDYARIHDGG